jgi:hypothetical protein
MEPAATDLEQMFGKDVPPGHIVDSYQVKVAPEFASPIHDKGVHRARGLRRAP